MLKIFVSSEVTKKNLNFIIWNMPLKFYFKLSNICDIINWFQN